MWTEKAIKTYIFAPLKNVSRKLAMFHMFNVKHFQTISNGKFALFLACAGQIFGQKAAYWGLSYCGMPSSTAYIRLLALATAMSKPILPQTQIKPNEQWLLRAYSNSSFNSLIYGYYRIWILLLNTWVYRNNGNCIISSAIIIVSTYIWAIAV